MKGHLLLCFLLFSRFVDPERQLKFSGLNNGDRKNNGTWSAYFQLRPVNAYVILIGFVLCGYGGKAQLLSVKDSLESINAFESKLRQKLDKPINLI
jgi:hypothetical protein